MDPKKRIIALGDSVMKGIIIDRQGDGKAIKYKVSDRCFSKVCSRELDVDIENLGRFGSTITDAGKVIDRNLERIRQADYAVLEWGGNDCDFRWPLIGKSPQADHQPRTVLPLFRNLYRDIIGRIRSLGVNIILLSLPPLDAARYFRTFTRNLCEREKQNILDWLGGTLDPINSWHEMYNLEVFKLAHENNIPVIDITSSFFMQRDYRNLLCDDGIHPNEEGQRLIAEAICRWASASA